MRKKLFASLIAPLVFAATVIFAGCSGPSSSGADVHTSSGDVSKGRFFSSTYSGENGARIVFDLDGTVEFLDNSGASARAVALSNGNLCAYGTYVVTADNIAQITIEEVLRDWGDISKNELDSYKDKEFAIKVAFSGNNLYITVDEKQLSFSTDKKDVSKPTIQSGPLFKNGAIDATYLVRRTLILENDTFSLTFNILYDYTEETIRGKYTKSGNTITFNDPTQIGGEDAKKATAIISNDTMTLTIESAEGSDTDKVVFKKGTSDKEWVNSEKLTLSSKGDVSYYVNGAICWNGTYTIIDAETASVNVKSGSIKDIFGTDQGNLYIDEADQKYLWLDLVDPDDSGGTAILFAREK